MRFALTADQALLRKTVRDLLEGSATRGGCWPRLAEVGLLSALVPEHRAGLGLTDVDVVPLVEESGRWALSEPLVETLVASGVLAAAGGDLADRWLPALAGGEAVLTVGFASATTVAWAGEADLLLLERDGALHAVPRRAARITPQSSADPGRPVATVRWSTGTALAADPAQAFDRAVLYTAAQLVGLAQGLLDRAVAHAKLREQFGRPIGAFQAVQHRLADVHVAVEFARPVVHRAAWSSTHRLPTRARDVSMAQHAGAEAARLAARAALQVHGAVGYTQEHPLHRWLERTWSLVPAYGGPDWHRERVAAAVLDTDSVRVP